MSHRIAFFLVVCASVLVLAAAQRFGGRFQFTNKSTAKLWVEIYGIEGNPPCGILVPGGNKDSFMGPTRLPKEATILWSEGDASYNDPKAKQHTNVISLSSLSNCPVDATVLFEFSSNRVWRVLCERR